MGSNISEYFMSPAERRVCSRISSAVEKAAITVRIHDDGTYVYAKWSATKDGKFHGTSHTRTWSKIESIEEEIPVIIQALRREIAFIEGSTGLRVGAQSWKFCDKTTKRYRWQ